jgi:TctA family transporter
MKKHIIPIIYMVCLTITIITVLYQHFEKGGVNRSGWGMLAIAISGNLMQINHWKEYFKK